MLGACPFWTDGDLEGPKTGARDKIGLGWICTQTGKGWRSKGEAVGQEFRIPCAETCRTYALSGPESPGCLVSVRYSISAGPANGHFTILDHRLPLLVTVFGNIGWRFLFSHRRSPSDNSISLRLHNSLNSPVFSARLRCGHLTAQIQRHYSSEPAATTYRAVRGQLNRQRPTGVCSV